MNLFSRKSPSPTTQLKIEGMSCSACVAHVEQALKSVPGVSTAQVDLAQKSAQISGNADAKDLIEAVEEAGYQAAIS